MSAATVPHVYTAILGVLTDIGGEGIAKDRVNTGQKYNFRGIDDVLNALNGLLSKHSLLILPRSVGRTEEERQTNNGGRMGYVTVAVEYDFVSAIDGSSHTVRCYGEAMDSADKATNKAHSASYKYMAIQAFCIPTEGDNDADGHSPDIAPRQAVQAQGRPAVQAQGRPAPAARTASKTEPLPQAKDILTAWNATSTEVEDMKLEVKEAKARSGAVDTFYGFVSMAHKAGVKPDPTDDAENNVITRFYDWLAARFPASTGEQNAA